jgi:hypothetical protein
MPSIQDKIISEREFSNRLGAGEPPGESAPPPGNRESRSGLSGRLVEEAIDQARLREAIGELPEGQRGELVETLLDQLGDGRERLPEELRERLLDGMVDELIAGKRGEREILGPDGVLGELTRRLIERALGEELTEHLGYPAGQGLGTRATAAPRRRC